jgi:hypothetical protein
MPGALEPYNVYNPPSRKDYSFMLLGVTEPYLTHAPNIESASNKVIAELGLTILGGLACSIPGDLGGIMYYLPIEGQSVLFVNSFPNRGSVEAVLTSGIRRLPRLQRMGMIFLNEFDAQEVSVVQNQRAKLLTVRGNGNEVIARPAPVVTAYIQARKRLTA